MGHSLTSCGLVVIRALCQPPSMLDVVKGRELDAQLVPPVAFADLLVPACHHEVLHVEARALDATEHHHRTPSLQWRTDVKTDVMHVYLLSVAKTLVSRQHKSLQSGLFVLSAEI